MHDCCPAHQFSESCDGTECQSEARPYILIDDRLDATARARRAQADILIAANLAIAAVASMMLVFWFVCIPAMKDAAKIDQERFVAQVRTDV